MSVDINRARNELPMRHLLDRVLHTRRSCGSAVTPLFAMRSPTDAFADLMCEQTLGFRTSAFAAPARCSAPSAANDANHGAQPPPKSPTG